MEALLEGLARHSDPEAAIVGHSLLEAVLEDAIRAHLVTKSDSRLFSQGAPLGTFWGLYTLGHAFGVIGDGLRTELQLLNDIRNKFAHDIHEVRFDQGEVAELCRSLRFPDIYVDKDCPAAGASDVAMGGSGRKGFVLKGPDGEVGVMLYQSGEELACPKTRFLASVRMCWFMLFSSALGVMPVPHWRSASQNGWSRQHRPKCPLERLRPATRCPQAPVVP